MLGVLAKRLLGDGAKKFRTFAGDNAFLNAAACVAANVTAADGDIAETEIKKAKRVMLANAIIKPSFDADAINKALDAALDRAETRSGRKENADAIEKMKGRDKGDREALFLIGVDVADDGGIGDQEDAVLAKIAALLDVDKAALID